MLDVEVYGSELLSEPLSFDEIKRLCQSAVATTGVEEGHLAVELVSPQRIAELNERFRGKAGPTDVLSFPIDGAELLPAAESLPSAESLPGAELPPAAELSPGAEALRGAGLPNDRAGKRAPRELGDIVICPQHTADVREAIVHGALHLIGMDHETDKGEMLALQAQLLRGAAA